MLILAGDIGAAASSLALFEVDDGELLLVRTAQIANVEYEALVPLLRRFTAADGRRLRAACFVISGEPPWVVNGDALGAAMRVPVGVGADGPEDEPRLWRAARRAAELAR